MAEAFEDLTSYHEGMHKEMASLYVSAVLHEQAENVLVNAHETVVQTGKIAAASLVALAMGFGISERAGAQGQTTTAETTPTVEQAVAVDQHHYPSNNDPRLFKEEVRVNRALAKEFGSSTSRYILALNPGRGTSIFKAKSKLAGTANITKPSPAITYQEVHWSAKKGKYMYEMKVDTIGGDAYFVRPGLKKPHGFLYPATTGSGEKGSYTATAPDGDPSGNNIKQVNLFYRNVSTPKKR